MHLVYLYGPPAVGKLTVATELAIRTGFKRFHNHLSIDCALPVFEFGTPAFWEVVWTIRIAVASEAARQGVDLIFTNVYEHPSGLYWVDRLFGAVENAGGSVHPVQLLCDRSELRKRVIGEGRAKAGKLATAADIDGHLDARDLTTPLPNRTTFSVDNTHLAPSAVVDVIVQHFGFPTGQ